jgi:cytochrome c oxidase assembly protein subunit 15
MEKRFRLVAKITLVGVFLVILAGSIVRMSGSGMGCPDWPKCFDCWIPPTDVSQLPDNYQEKFLEERERKLENFSRLLSNLGFKKEAKALLTDESLREPEEFNAGKTWTEYINRLIGFLTGNLMLLMFIMSFWFWRKRRSVFLFSFLNLFLILFTAWFGAIVVATNLLPWIISVHMVLAFLIVCIQIYIIHRSDTSKFRFKVKPGVKGLLILAFILLFVQIILGTQVRQQIDLAASQLGEEGRSSWVDNLDIRFLIHRSFSIALFLLVAFLSWKNIKHHYGMNLLNLVLLIFVFEIITGVLLYYTGMPKGLQPLHLLLSGISLAMLLHLIFKTNRY